MEFYIKKCFLVLLLVLVINSFSAFAGIEVKTLSSDKLWQEVEDSGLKQKSARRSIVPNNYRTFVLNKTALKDLLNKTSTEFTDAARSAQIIMTLPMPDGTFERFSIEESQIMEPQLSAQFPEIKTYRGQGIDDPTATARFDFMPSGFHSMIISSSGTVLVDPYAKGDTDNYISYFKQDTEQSGEFSCQMDETISGDFYKSDDNFLHNINDLSVSSGATLRTYRLAVAATGEYTAVAGGGTVAGALAAQVQVINRVNGIYERDLAIRLMIVANNNSIIYTDAATDPYTNNSGSTMLGQNQSNLDSVIGSANYDIGHVFSTGGGGIGYLRSPCSKNKARGVTGISNPVGDNFTVDYVAHEIGHQFGANHTFNANVSQRAGAAYEPGSGITIMGYAGVVPGQNLAAHSIDTFHVRSLEEIIAFKENTVTGGSCGSESVTGNTAPTVTVPANFTIPKLTPFALTANAADSDGDSITYDWQEYDLGGATTVVPNTDSDGVPRPIFRPYLPTTSGTRFFPSLTYILNNANVPPNTISGYLTGELLPAITRTMRFQVIARDNRANGGGINTATTSVVIDGNSGPFVITAPNDSLSWNGNSTQTISWDVAGTTVEPINAANVRILLSTDGGQTFPTVLAASTVNDGDEKVTIPNMTTTAGRIKVEAIGNIFFDINDANFTINATYGIEGDINPQLNVDGNETSSNVNPLSNGDGVVQSNDVTQAQRYEIGLDQLFLSNDCQRADSAPRETRGDGKITSVDTIQAQRYAIGLDALTPAGGPTAPCANQPLQQEGMGKSGKAVKTIVSASQPQLRVENATSSAGQQVTVNIRIDALGDESGNGFILNYNNAVLQNPSVLIGMAGGSKACNLTFAGEVRCSVRNFDNNNPASSTDQIGEIGAGNNQILVKVIFTVAPGASPGTTPLTLSNVNASNDLAQSLAITGQSGTVAIAFPTAAEISVSGRVTTNLGRGIRNVDMTLTDAGGNKLHTRTTAFGYYQFQNIAAGEIVVITAKAKRFKFNQSSIVRTVTEQISDANFVSEQ
jgi:hypothetical protein